MEQKPGQPHPDLPGPPSEECVQLSAASFLCAQCPEAPPQLCKDQHQMRDPGETEVHITGSQTTRCLASCPWPIDHISVRPLPTTPPGRLRGVHATLEASPSGPRAGQSESVRDVQFSIRDYFTFASTFENGNVQLWDIRRPDRCERMFTAHNGPVFCCDWHPEDRGWLATGGRDKMVKVWDMTTHRAKEVHCVQTIASVARVKWRPECRHHLATCSMMVDHNIYVWDVRRPFVPAAMFEEHRDVTTGIAWRHPHDPSFLLSGSKDSTLCQHLFRDASQPVERANPEGLCYGLFGDLAFAAKESLVATESGRKPYAGDRRHPIFFKRKLDPSEPFVGLASSALSVFEIEPGSGSMSWFVDTAERYALAGRPLAELCDHNAKVARELGRNQVAQTWTMLRIIYCSPGLASATNLNHSVGKGSSCGLPLMNSFNLKDMAPGLGSETRLDRSKGDTRSDTVLLDSSATLLTNEDNEETEGSDVPADYLLGDVEGEEDELYLLEPEHAHEQGDVQMAVSVLIVLGERVRKDIDEQTQEHWYTSYIDLLQRFCLWNVSNQVVKLSTSRAISCLNQASTTLHVNCSHCKRPMSSRGWVCDRCHRCASMCAVCHHVVKGLFVWCQGCSHGGHLQHIMKWLEGSSHCPAGCGHLCEYS
eukprot:XP_013970205.1 GATOR complex protein WDR24 isoform X2 [Canis lupus familiaris]